MYADEADGGIRPDDTTSRPGAPDSMAIIWDSKGRKIGEVKDLGNGDQNTYDHNGQPLGKVRKLGTYGKEGRKISSTRDAGLTFGKRGKNG
jgi:hypothetical protein